VIFTAPNGQSSSSDIAYEVPVIRGFVHRKIATDLKFPGVLLYPDLPFVGVPRKFRGLTHTWNFDSTSVTQYLSGPVTLTAHQGGSYGRQMYLYTRSHSISGEAHESETTTDPGGSGNYQWNWDRTYGFDLTEPGASDPSGLVSVDSTDAITQTSGDSRSWEEHLQLGFGLQPFQVANAGGTAVSPLPFSSFSATDQGRYFDGYQSNGDNSDFSWSASPSLVADSDGQHLNWSGSYDWSIVQGGTTSTTHGEHNYGGVGYGLGSASVAVGDFYPGRTGVVTASTGTWVFPTHGDNPHRESRRMFPSAQTG
jgi:hypothetical protein